MLRRQWMAAVLALGLGWSAPEANAGDRDPGVVIQWNTLIQETGTGASAGPLQVRFYAMAHIAMFEAANSIARQYAPFHAVVPASSGASMEAAAAQAAYDVLVELNKPAALHPGFAAALQAKLSALPPGLAAQGVSVGHAAAARVLAWHLVDGTAPPDPAYVLPLVPGLWQPFPAPAALTRLRAATPFTLVSRTQFLVGRHPEMDSARYLQDFDEVKSIGSAASITRSAEQTEVARLWGDGTYSTTNIFAIWNALMREAASSMTLLEAARAFALMNASMFDGLLTSQNGKFIYGLWRPVTAIRNAAGDPHPGTLEDPAWLPLIGTPPYPSYPGNMACLGAAAAETLVNVTGGGGGTLHVTWQRTGGNAPVTRHYPGGYKALAQEEADSRIYGGIHYRFDNEASQEACTKVADWADSKIRRLR